MNHFTSPRAARRSPPAAHVWSPSPVTPDRVTPHPGRRPRPARTGLIHTPLGGVRSRRLPLRDQVVPRSRKRRIGPEGEALGRPVTAAQPSFEQWAEATESPDVRRVGMRTLYTDYDPFGIPGGNAVAGGRCVRSWSSWQRPEGGRRGPRDLVSRFSKTCFGWARAARDRPAWRPPNVGPVGISGFAGPFSFVREKAVRTAVASSDSAVRRPGTPAPRSRRSPRYTDPDSNTV